MRHIFVFTFFLSLLSAEIKYLTPAEIQTLSKKSKILSNSFTHIIEGIDENGSYFLDLRDHGKNVNCFIDKKTGKIYKGDRYDSNGTKSIFIKSPARIAKFQKTIDQSTMFSYGTGKENLYVFTDPECPYCQKFERKVKGLLDKYKVHVILYPLRFHKKAPAMTAWILDAKSDKERYHRMEEVMINHSQVYKKFTGKPYTPETKQILNQGMNAVRLLYVRGTPSIFDKDFKKINWGTLLRNIKK